MLTYPLSLLSKPLQPHVSCKGTNITPNCKKDFEILSLRVKKLMDMDNKIKVGVLKETKTPPDRRVALAPEQAVETIKRFNNIELFIQSSDIRCFTDDEYKNLGLNVVDDISHCDILLGVKEVHIPYLLANKKYLFFSHTAKKQPYNRKLLQELVKKNIQMIDHEYLTDKNNVRVVAFGRWAGIVGAYNGLIAFGKKNKLYDLKRAYQCHDMNEMLEQVKTIKLPPIKILITGKGRVGKGALETLAPLNLKQVSPDEFLTKNYDEPVVCIIDADTYTKHKDGKKFEFSHFFKHPEEYVSIFKPFTKVTDLYIACHFWDPKSPVFMTPDDYKEKDFKISVIADVSCDIKDPIPSTLRASTIADPFYGYNKHTGHEDDPWAKDNVTVMAVDNLPGELPRDASVDFSKALMEKVFPSLFGEDKEGIIERASITKDGKLTPRFSYLQDFLEGK
ncbi:MAG: NAD(P)-dependent oxidoreductase [Marinilabiliales bacterium]